MSSWQMNTTTAFVPTYATTLKVTRPKYVASTRKFKEQCGHKVCDTDFTYCCKSRFGTYACCAGERMSSSNNFKWWSWIGGGIAIFVVVCAIAWFIHRQSKSKSRKRQVSTRFAPAAGMSHSESRSSADGDGAGVDTGDFPADIPPPALTPPPPPLPLTQTSDSIMSASAVFPTGGLPHVSVRCTAVPRLPPYSAPGINLATTPRGSVLTDDQRRHAARMDATATGLAQSLPEYDAVPDSPLAGRLTFHTQTSRDQLLPLLHMNSNYDLETPVTPPPDDGNVHLLEPPPAYTS